jgi:hypothetical protein
LITPNYHEIIQLSPAETNAEISQNAISILLKKADIIQKKIGIDTLYTKSIPFFTQKSSLTENMVQVVFYRLLLFLTLL